MSCQDMLMILDKSLNFSSDILVLRSKDWNQNKKIGVVKWIWICEPELRCIPLHLVIFSLQAQYSIIKQTRGSFILSIWKKPQTILLLQLEMQCLSGKERGRVKCTWRKTDVHPCGNQGKTHSCGGRSSIVVGIPCCGNPNHKLELSTKTLC